MDNTDSRERLVRVESTIGHIDGKVREIEGKLTNHESVTNVSFTQLCEISVKEPTTTENLLKTVQEQSTRHTEQDSSILQQIGSIEERLQSINTRVISITIGGGLVWVLLGSKVLQVLGLQ